MQLSKDKQEAVTPFQSSQYFTFKAQDFMSEDAIAGILTNNSNLLTSKSKPFRQKLLKEYSDNENVDAIVMGHTHLVSYQKYGKDRLYDGGSTTMTKTYIQIENGIISVQKVRE